MQRDQEGRYLERVRGIPRQLHPAARSESDHGRLLQSDADLPYRDGLDARWAHVLLPFRTGWCQRRVCRRRPDGRHHATDRLGAGDGCGPGGWRGPQKRPGHQRRYLRGAQPALGYLHTGALAVRRAAGHPRRAHAHRRLWGLPHRRADDRSHRRVHHVPAQHPATRDALRRAAHAARCRVLCGAGWIPHAPLPHPAPRWPGGDPVRRSDVPREPLAVLAGGP